MHDAHRKADEHREPAAHTHRPAAEQNGERDNVSGNWHSERLLEYSDRAYKLARGSSHQGRKVIRHLLPFLCVAGLLAGQDPSSPDRGLQKADSPDDLVIRETFKFVLVPVTVTDRSGNLINGLTPLDFRLTDNSKIQSITGDVASHPLSLVVAIQANADVETILPQIQKLSSVFESMVLGDNGEMAVLGFDHRTQTLADFTSEPAKIDAAFKNLKPGSYSSNLNECWGYVPEQSSGQTDFKPVEPTCDAVDA
jgi:hypothetical protein